MIKRHHLLTALLLISSACTEPGENRPNVLLITLDTTRADRLGCYGWTEAETPNIDALSLRGARFDLALSTAGITPMSHASILTGLNPYNHGLRVFHGAAGNKLAPEISTLPERLSKAGYQTGGFVSAYPLSPYYGLDQGFDTYSTGIEDTIAGIDLTQPVRSLQENVLLDQDRSRVQRRADATTSEALSWLKERSPDSPWFSWIHFFDAHDVSLVPPTQWAAEHGVEYGEAPHQRDLAGRESLYDLEIAWMDAQLGRLFLWLEETGQLDNTLVVLTADHGQGLSRGERLHAWSRHRLIYQWSIHVPLIIAGPSISPRSSIDAMVRTTDIAPTLLELLDLAPEAPMDGSSLSALMNGAEDGPRIAYADALNTHDSFAPLARLPENCRDDLICASDGRYKLIHHIKTPEMSELFDLRNDPDEQQNLYSTEPEIASRLHSFLFTEGALSISERASSGEAPNQDALNGLGYTGESEDSE
jgi:arylsulfatase A-like enzyme